MPSEKKKKQNIDSEEKKKMEGGEGRRTKLQENIEPTP